MDHDLLNQAYQEWENFIKTLSDDEKEGSEGLFEAVESNSLHHFAAIKDVVRFDQIVNKLTNKNLFDEEILPTVYNFYIERGLHELAFDHLIKAIKYYEENDLGVPTKILSLREAYPDEQTLQKLKLILGNLPSQRAIDIPKILPSHLNGKLLLSEFILSELVQAAKVMLDKIESVRQITHENRFSDLLLASLRLRLPIWGWTIQDQSRIGSSPGDKDAGETDLLIQAGGNNIALIEAFILRDRNYTEAHILKCPKYIKSLDRYYVLIYCLDQKDFTTNWDRYKNDIFSINYPSDFSVEKVTGFEDLSKKFENVNNFKIAKTVHGSKEVFHLFIDLSTSPAI